MKTKSDIIHKKTTYGELRDFLASLGFEEIKRSGHVVFRNTDFDSLITLPRHRRDKFVESRHLAMVRGNLIGKGVLRKDEQAGLGDSEEDRISELSDDMWLYGR